MEKNASLLIAAAFTMIGFCLGRVTAPEGHGAATVVRAMDLSEAMGGPGEDIQLIVESFDDADFEGDTVFAIPGGQVHIVRNGEEMQVEVEMTEEVENVWVQEGQANGTTVVQKQFIVTSDED
jgi:hypothetical protein